MEPKDKPICECGRKMWTCSVDLTWDEWGIVRDRIAKTHDRETFFIVRPDHTDEKEIIECIGRYAVVLDKPVDPGA